MFIWEGIDGAGKTTRAVKLASALAADGRLTHYERYSVLPWWWDYGSDYARSIHVHAVVDRFTTSELAYGPVLRKEVHPNFTHFKRAVIARELARVGAVTIYMRPPLTVCYANVMKRGDWLIKTDVEATLRKLYLKFDELILTTPPGQLPYGPNERIHTTQERTHCDLTRMVLIQDLIDVSNQTFGVDEDVEAARAAYDVTQSQTRWFDGLKFDGSGPVDGTAEVIIVGEQQNWLASPDRAVKRAFANGPASAWLHDTFTLAGVDMRAAFVINAKQPNGTETPGHVFDRLAQQSLDLGRDVPIVACGRVAQEHLDGCRVPFIAMDHPAYLKRFEHGQQVEQAADLKRDLAAWRSS